MFLTKPDPDLRSYTEAVEQPYTVSVPVTEQVAPELSVSVPYTEMVDQSYTVQVPVQEQRTAYRTVSHCVPVQSFRTVTRDMGGSSANKLKSVVVAAVELSVVRAVARAVAAAILAVLHLAVMDAVQPVVRLTLTRKCTCRTWFASKFQ